MAPNQLHDQIVAALACLRAARADQNTTMARIAEDRLNTLLDRVDRLVPA